MSELVQHGFCEGTLVERLRFRAMSAIINGQGITAALLREAADEIEARGEPLQRSAPTAEGLARAIADALKPGVNGTPEIVERFGNLDGSRAGFVVASKESDESYRVTVERL